MWILGVKSEPDGRQVFHLLSHPLPTGKIEKLVLILNKSLKVGGEGTEHTFYPNSYKS